MTLLPSSHALSAETSGTESTLERAAQENGPEPILEVRVSTDRQGDPTTPKSNQQPSKNENEASSIERFVRPFTEWAEDKIHNSSLIRTKPSDKQNKLPSSAMNLREAILLATEKYPGTVLSADRVDEQGSLTYHIRVISKEGIVRTVYISESSAKVQE